MSDKPFVISLKAQPAEQGFDILAINTGVAKGHAIEFTPAVLKESVGLWDAVPCMLDHPGFFEGPSVRDLAGSLHDPVWNETEKGIQASLIPGGPQPQISSCSCVTPLEPILPSCPPWVFRRSCG